MNNKFKDHTMINKSILLVTNQPIIEKVFRHVLEDRNYKVYSSHNAYDSLKEILKEDIDIMLCDAELKFESGFTLARLAKSLKPHLGIMMLTKKANIMHQKLAEKHGYSYLTSPIKISTTYRKIKAMMYNTTMHKMAQSKFEKNFYPDLVSNIS